LFEVTMEVAHIVIAGGERGFLDRQGVAPQHFRGSLDSTAAQVLPKGNSDFSLEQTLQVLLRQTKKVGGVAQTPAAADPLLVEDFEDNTNAGLHEGLPFGAVQTVAEKPRGNNLCMKSRPGAEGGVFSGASASRASIADGAGPLLSERTNEVA
jgi:hypothetical protein